eukprot:1157790-Pelagomonas_calceolata.AAC.16
MPPACKHTLTVQMLASAIPMAGSSADTAVRIRQAPDACMLSAAYKPTETKCKSCDDACTRCHALVHMHADEQTHAQDAMR